MCSAQTKTPRVSGWRQDDLAGQAVLLRTREAALLDITPARLVDVEIGVGRRFIAQVRPGGAEAVPASTIVSFGVASADCGMERPLRDGDIALLVSVEELARELPVARQGHPEIAFGKRRRIDPRLLPVQRRGNIALLRPIEIASSVLKFFLAVGVATLIVIALLMGANRCPDGRRDPDRSRHHLHRRRLIWSARPRRWRVSDKQHGRNSLEVRSSPLQCACRRVEQLTPAHRLGIGLDGQGVASPGSPNQRS